MKLLITQFFAHFQWDGYIPSSVIQNYFEMDNKKLRKTFNEMKKYEDSVTGFRLTKEIQ